MRPLINLVAALAFVLLLTTAPDAQPNVPEDLSADEVEESDRMPPRLSYVDGEVLFFRPGGPDWAPALVNTALAPGDRLRTGAQGSLELQIGSQAFLRTWAESDFGLEDQGRDLLRFEVAEGHVVLDLRDLEPGRTMEIYTPNAAFAVRRAGYYRVNVTGGRTSWIVRDGGRAFVVPAEDDPFDIGSDEEAVIEGSGRASVSSAPARPRDSWDDWNQSRTEYVLAESSSRRLPPGVYGAGDLERHGRWQATPEYGSVWVPTAVPPDWAPYSSGQWMHDPYYGWTWVDAAPWGWAPFHHGRWLYSGGRWCWAPGPWVARPVYAPALVAFFSSPQSRIAVGLPGPTVGWVALGWGEPCVPWWGRPGFARRPWWGGWGGPRVVNNRVVHRTTLIHADAIHTYRNARVRHAIFSAPRGDFERRGGAPGRRFDRLDAGDLRPMFTGPPRRATPVGSSPHAPRVKQPSDRGPDRPARILPPRRDRPQAVETTAPGPEKRRITPIPRSRERNGERVSPPSDRAATVPPSARNRTPAPHPEPIGQRRQGAPDRNRVLTPAPAPQPRVGQPVERGGRPQRPDRPPRPRELDRRVPERPAPTPVGPRPGGTAEMRHSPQTRSAERLSPHPPETRPIPRPGRPADPRRRLEQSQPPAEARLDGTLPFSRRRP